MPVAIAIKIPSEEREELMSCTDRDRMKAKQIEEIMSTFIPYKIEYTFPDEKGEAPEDAQEGTIP